jgi:hypothetical protein
MVKKLHRRPSVTSTHRKSAKYLITALFLLVVIHAYDYVYKPELLQPNIPEASSVELTQQRITHILQGDASGGGHYYGTGKPCKSEFPQDWDRERILTTIKRIGANDNGNWRREDNGYYVTEEMVDGVNVRVVLGPQKRKVITSYPTNVERNPCPANDN